MMFAEEPWACQRYPLDIPEMESEPGMGHFK